MKAIIDKAEFEELFDSLFMVKKEEPIRSFRICAVKGISSFVEYIVDVYPSKISLTTGVIVEGPIATIEDGKEKFINDVNEFFSKLKNNMQTLIDNDYVDEVIVKAVKAANYDQYKYVTIKFDDFIDIFTKLMDIFIKEIE